jgi:hypothetical protein
MLKTFWVLRLFQICRFRFFGFMERKFGVAVAVGLKIRAKFFNLIAKTLFLVSGRRR